MEQLKVGKLINRNIKGIFFILLTVWLTVLSQQTVFQIEISLKSLCDIMWFASVLIVLAVAKLMLPVSKFWLIYLVGSIILFTNNYILKDVIGKVPALSFMDVSTPLIIYFVFYTYFIVRGTAEKERTIIHHYLAACIGLAVLMLLTLNINWSDWLNSMIYLVQGKNGIGHMLGVGIIIAFFYLDNQKSAKPIIKWGKKIIIIVLFLITLIYIQCRTALLATSLAIFVVGLYFIKNRKIKRIIYIGMFIGLLIILFNDRANSIITHSLFLDKYNDTDSFLSGRLTLNGLAFEFWKEAPIFGGSFRYVDNFYLNMLQNYGIVGGLFLFGIWFYRIWRNYKNSRVIGLSNPFSQILMSVTIFELIVSFLEAYPPLGPGSSIMVMWMVSAISDVYVKNINMVATAHLSSLKLKNNII